MLCYDLRLSTALLQQCCPMMNDVIQPSLNIPLSGGGGGPGLHESFSTSGEYHKGAGAANKRQELINPWQRFTACILIMKRVV